MLLVFKVAANLTRGWKLGRASAQQPAHPGAMAASHQERALSTAPTATAAALVASERVRSTVASIENMTSTHRLSVQSAVPLPAAAPIPQLGFASNKDARGQLRYLHHRVAGVSNTHSREMLR
jgi:hypothetical protein